MKTSGYATKLKYEQAQLRAEADRRGFLSSTDV